MIVSDEVLQAGAEVFRYDPADLQPIDHGGAPDGAVYQSAGWIVKFIPARPDQLPGIRDKIAFVSYLRENGVPVPDVCVSRHGNLIETLEVDGQLYAVSQMVKAPGHPIRFDQDWDPRFFWEQWGSIIGKIHALSQRYTGGANIITWEQEHAFFANWCKDDAVREKWCALGDDLRALPHPPDAFGVIHNDPHAFNFLIDSDSNDSGGTVTILDFDVAARHWFAMDIAIALFHPLWEQRHRPAAEIEASAREFSRHWLAGYRRENTLDPVWLERLPLFARYRRALFFTALSNEGQGEWAERTVADLRAAILADAPVVGLDVVMGV